MSPQEKAAAKRSRRGPGSSMTLRGANARAFMSAAEESMRRTPLPNSEPIKPETFERLLCALEAIYPGKVRRAVDVCPVAVNKTIDNEADALATISNCEAAQNVACAICNLPRGARPWTENGGRPSHKECALREGSEIGNALIAKGKKCGKGAR